MYHRRKKSAATNQARYKFRSRLARSKQRLHLARKLALESLEGRQLLAVTPMTVTGGVELELSGNIDNLEDIYLRTDSDGNLEWGTSADGTFTDLVDLSSGVSDYEVKVTFKSGATGDAAKFDLSLEEDLKSTLFLQTIIAPGVDLTFGAMDIEVTSGATISTRVLGSGVTDQVGGASGGDSGDLTINGVLVDVRSGAQLLTHVGDNDSTNLPGAITIDAEGKLDKFQSSFGTIPFVPSVSVTKARALFESATLKGGDVTIDVESDSSDLFDDEDTAGGMGEPVAEFFGSLSAGVGVAISQATAEITVDGTQIVGRDVSLSSQAATDAEAFVLTVFAAYAYGQSEPTATVDIRNGSSIRTTGDLDVTTWADSDMNIIATQNLIGTSTTTEKYNITGVGVYSDLVSKANLSSDSTLNVGSDLLIDVGGVREHNTQSNAAAYNDGTLAVALNVVVHNATLESLIDGTVVTGGDMTVDAELETLKNDYNATSTVGTGELGGRILAGSKAGGVLRSFSKAFNFFFPSGNGGGGAAGGEWGRILKDAGKGLNLGDDAVNERTPNKFDVAASINAGLSFNEIDVRIGPGASVDVGGDLILRGHVEEFPETSAISFLNSSNAFLPDAPIGTYSQRETGLSGALTGGYFDNEIDVYIGAGATVVVDGDMTIVSESSIPYDPQYVWDWRSDELEPARVSTVTDKLNYNLGIQNGFFSSWAEAIAGAQSKAIGVMLNVLLGNTHNHAYIGDGATVTVGGDLIISADTANDTINFVGSPLLPFNASAGRGIGAAFMGTGYFSDTNARINPLAEVDADSLLVFANNRGRNISIGIQGGLSDGAGGFNGVFTSTFVDARTISKISPSAEITLSDGLVEVPIPFEEIRKGGNTLSAIVPVFGPAHPYTEEDTSLTRVNPDNETITLPFDHHAVTGTPMIYDSHGGTDIGGLTSGETYFAIVADNEPTVLKLASSYAGAIAGNALNLNLDAIGDDVGEFHTLYPGFDPTDSDQVSIADSTIDVGYEHGLTSGFPVVYDTDGGTAIGGLDDGKTYYVSVTGPTTYRLALTSADAVEAETDGDTSRLISFSTGAAGRSHTLYPTGFDLVKNPDLPRVLDTNGDRQVNSDDDYVTGVNDIAVVNEVLNIQTDTNLLVLANDQTNLFNGSGVLTKTLSSASGGAVNVNVINRRTEALIGAEERVTDDSPFTPELGVDSTGLIRLDYAHGFSLGDEVVYTAGGDYPIDGLRDRGVYVVTTSGNQDFRVGRSFNERNTKFGSAAVNETHWTIDLGYTHKLQTGDAVRFTNESAPNSDDIGGLSDGEVYYVIAVDGTKVSLAYNLEDVADQHLHRFTPSTSVADNLIYLGYQHGLQGGQELLYKAGGGTAVGGLTDGKTYEVRLNSEEPLAIELVDPDTDKVVTLDPSVARGVAHTLHPAFHQADVDVTASDIFTNTIDLGYAHDLQTGDAVQLSGASGLGLTDGQRYYAIVLTDTQIALADSESDADAGRTQYFLPTKLLDNGDAAAGKTDTIDVYAEHGFQNGDTVLYLKGQSFDIGLTDGATYTVRLLDPATTSLETPTTKLQLLDGDGNLVEFDAVVGISEMYGSLVNLSARKALTGGTATTPVYLNTDPRIELTKPSLAFNAYSLKLAIDPLTTLDVKHGFAKSFDPSTALSDTDTNEILDTIDLGYTH
ncbi:MAG: hypothetical protein MI861_07970, partial [Pirellulales bacterium]|nr:hypothetical protein [Pirellulales bacterium]